MLRGYVGTFLSLAGVACGLTWLYLGMRGVMEIGGSCASGGPYQIAQPCPEGVPLLMIGGIFGALICLGVFLWASSKLGGDYGSIAGFAWPALFLSLGWNFLDYGIDPPGEGEGLVWGWLFCAVLFGLMGGLPLLGLLKPSTLRMMFWPDDPKPDAFGRRPSASPLAVPLGANLTLGDVAARRRRSSAGAPGSKAAPAGDDDDVVAQLERLAALKERGALDAEEFERAKKAVLDG